MNYWLVVTTRENFDVSASKKVNFNVDGFKEGCLKRVERIEKGDRFVCYITSESVFGAIYKAESEYKPNNNDKILEGLIWADEKRQGEILYPLRFRTKKILALPNVKMLDARRVIENLQSVHNKKSWGWFVHHSLREIPKEDFEYIEAEMKKTIGA